MATLVEELEVLSTEQLKTLVIELCVNGQSEPVMAIINRWKARREAQVNKLNPPHGKAETGLSRVASIWSPAYNAVVPIKTTQKRKRGTSRLLANSHPSRRRTRYHSTEAADEDDMGDFIEELWV
jgi:hypothetical protein